MLNSQPISSLKGIGEKTAKLYEKLGVFTIADLLSDYPRAYDTFEPPVPVGNLMEDQVMAVCASLTKAPDLVRFNRMQMVSVYIRDITGSLQIVWFNMPYMKSNLKPGIFYVFRGRVVRKRGRLMMEQPEVYSKEAYDELAPSMQPVYSQTKGLGNKAIVKALRQALESRTLEREYMPSYIRKKHQLAEINYAVEHIHFPEDQSQLLFARKRLVFDEFFFFLTGVRKLNERKADRTSSYVMKPSDQVKTFLNRLPYKLTQAQMRTWSEILTDLSGGLIMNRLIQGDVGSGKTIVAFLALLTAAYNGFQAALMAPTEVLARQHYESLSQMLSKQGMEIRTVLITGSMNAKEKREAYEKIRSHQTDLIIGTHALIQEKVEYDNLALVITDEQHRFGVGQRELFSDKGKDPHILVMSATPIPRTLAIILYGDLDISVIDQLPQGRQPIKNCVVNPQWRPKAYDFIRKQVEEGRQAYVICPMVEPSELLEAENVLDYTKKLRKELPSSITVEYLHGQMKGKKKNAVMERFASGDVQVLVSTTVIEVGVNVPNATVMMIENAERFGLAQLHQLRGRVGRGDFQSYCIMVNCSGEEGVSKRLDILNHSNDGFYIASQDLKLRGPGDIFGMRQSGDLEFKLADIFTDAPLLKSVSEEVNQLLDQDPELSRPEHQELKQKLDSYIEKKYEKLIL